MSRESRAVAVTAHRVTVQPWAKKRKVSWRLLKIENQLLPLFSGPISPRKARGDGELFLWGFAGGRSPHAKPPYFFSPPQRRLRRWGGGWGGTKVTATTRFSAVGSCQAGDGIPRRTGESSQPLFTTRASHFRACAVCASTGRLLRLYVQAAILRKRSRRGR